MERFGAEGYLVTARQGHPEIGSGLDLEPFLPLEHVLVSFRGDFRGREALALSKINAARKVKVGAPMLLSGVALVQRSDLLLAAPARSSGAFASTFELALHEAPFEIATFDVSVVRASRKRGEPGLIWIVSQVRNIWKSSA